MKNRKGVTMAKKSTSSKGKKESHSRQTRTASPGKGETHSRSGSSTPVKQGKSLGKSLPSKDGCLPKLGMLLMPFIAVGAFLFLRP
jgi:hypothetical protein